MNVEKVTVSGEKKTRKLYRNSAIKHNYHAVRNWWVYPVSSEETQRNRTLNSSNGYFYGQGSHGSTEHESHGYRSQQGSISEPRISCGSSSSSNSAKYGT